MSGTDISDVVGTQLLFLNSVPDEQIQSFEFGIDMLTCNGDEDLSLSLQSICFNKNNGYIVNATNNTITFTRHSDGQITTISIVPGSYTYSEFSNQVSKQIGFGKCLYLRNQKKLEFVFTEPYTISFPNLTCAGLFGFQSLTTATASSITSDTFLDFFFDVNNVCLRLYGLSPVRRSFDNFSGNTQPSNIFAIIPWNQSTPFACFNHTFPNPYEVQIADKNLSILYCEITDTKGNILSSINDYTLVFEVKTCKKKRDEMLSIGRELLRMSKVKFFHKYF